MPGRHTLRKPRHRRIQMKALSYALDGNEKPYDVYRFSNGKKKIERPLPPDTTYRGTIAIL